MLAGLAEAGALSAAAKCMPRPVRMQSKLLSSSGDEDAPLTAAAAAAAAPQLVTPATPVSASTDLSFALPDNLAFLQDIELTSAAKILFLDRQNKQLRCPGNDSLLKQKCNRLILMRRKIEALQAGIMTPLRVDKLPLALELLRDMEAEQEAWISTLESSNGNVRKIHRVKGDPDLWKDAAGYEQRLLILRSHLVLIQAKMEWLSFASKCHQSCTPST